MSGAWGTKRSCPWLEVSSFSQDEILSHFSEVTFRPLQVTRIQSEGMKDYINSSADSRELALCFVLDLCAVKWEKRERSILPDQGTGEHNSPKSQLGL